MMEEEGRWAHDASCRCRHSSQLEETVFSVPKSLDDPEPGQGWDGRTV